MSTFFNQTTAPPLLFIFIDMLNYIGYRNLLSMKNQSRDNLKWRRKKCVCTVQLFTFLHKQSKIMLRMSLLWNVRQWDISGNIFNPRHVAGQVMLVMYEELTPVSYQYGTLESKLWECCQPVAQNTVIQVWKCLENKLLESRRRHA